MDTSIVEKHNNYQDRYQTWSERAIDQFSFSNNLLLTISIAVLGYFFTEEKNAIKRISIWRPGLNSFDLEATLFVIATVFVVLSIMFGLIVTLARLYDFRLTRHIALIRKHVYIKHVKVFPDKKPDKKTLKKSLCDLVVFLFVFHGKKISWLDYQTYNEALQSKFETLRSIANGFGNLSWCAFNMQYLSFLIGFLIYIFYVFSHVCRL